ncbi:peptidoglycan recognition protein family protein [Corynebacterium minutissimum]|uniref:N-acetylmuramoyl-L-alanine amidase n=1 Tax=Corynebacterium minutissimum TaxID=38301 RepID=A0A376CXG6_9CORY|nr:peptidoglycan recognition family protein [Corynebacterium minutissimum]QRP60668.1 N-acetylmuramoyl-L-alanine amidase [Corynebacterium minutissimum]STC76752.1 N-acetylmuramoyl-L-alanine amidase [Corynebacterium minutissimum]
MTTPYYDIDWSNKFPFGGPRRLPIRGICIHTTESPTGTPAENVAQYQLNSRTGSYHCLVDSKGWILRENTDDWTTWSTGNKGNDILLHLSFVTYASNTREQWLKLERMLRRGAAVVAYWCKTHNIPAKSVNAHGLPGITSHDATRVWGGTDHTDPGKNFPWDVFIQYVKEAMAGKHAKKEEAPAAAPADKLAKDIATIKHELTHRFDSRYDLDELRRGSIGVNQVYKDTLVGYVLNTDRKVEDIHKNKLPAIYDLLEEILKELRNA